MRKEKASQRRVRAAGYEPESLLEAAASAERCGMSYGAYMSAKSNGTLPLVPPKWKLLQ